MSTKRPYHQRIPMEPKMEAAAVTEIVDVDDYDDNGFFSTPISNIGKTKNNPISIERYSELRDLNLAIMASLQSSQEPDFIDLSEYYYWSDDELKVLHDMPLTTSSKRPKKNRDRVFSPEPAQSSNSKADPEFLCEICVEPKSLNDSFPIKGCKHAYCKECMTKYVASKLQENISTIGCPVSDCEGLLEPEYCRAILPQEVFDRWGNALCESVILGSEKFYCPYKDCSAMMIDDGDKGIKESECPNCRRLFCAQCKVPWHSEINCEEFQKLHKDERNREDIMLKKLAENSRWRRCPNCKIYVERTDGCGYMRCRCKCAFCYYCGVINKSGSHTCPSCNRCY